MSTITEISRNIHYVGVNDRTKHLFEGLWPLPLGVSYNSYLIVDKSVVLIDTVDHCYTDLFFEKIKNKFRNTKSESFCEDKFTKRDLIISFIFFILLFIYGG